MQVLDHEGKLLREESGLIKELLSKAGLELEKDEVGEVRIIKPKMTIPKGNSA